MPSRPRIQRRSHHRLGHPAAAQAAQQGLELAPSMGETVSTSWPGIRFTVRGASWRAESATATMRQRGVLRVARWVRHASASGWWGRPRTRKASRPAARMATPAPGAVRAARRWPGRPAATDQRLPGAGHHFGAQAQSGAGPTLAGRPGRSLRVERDKGFDQLQQRGGRSRRRRRASARFPSRWRHGGRGWPRRRSRISSRRPSCSSSWPAAVNLAWRERRSNSSTSSASSSWRTL
jgi:hypothetical protein